MQLRGRRVHAAAVLRCTVRSPRRAPAQGTALLIVCHALPHTPSSCAQVVALISAVGDLFSAYALPCLFSLKLLKLPGWERALCVLLIPLSAGISLVGVWSSVAELISKVLGAA